jgi:hypothetical protein
MFKVEKNILRFYKYKFQGFEDNPLVIEAYNKLEARRKLSYYLDKFPKYKTIPIVDESLYLPIFGETTKDINGIEHVWVGQIRPNNWMPLDEFLNLGL